MSLHRPRWISVGKKECSECRGSGVQRGWENQISWMGLAHCRREWPCGRCRGKGEEDVGYMDSRDASGR